MANNPDTFTGYIRANGHHTAWKMIMLVFALAVIVVVSMLFSSWFTSRIPERLPDQTVQTALTDAERAALLDKPSSIPPLNPGMTDAQRQAHMSKPSSIPPIQ